MNIKCQCHNNITWNIHIYIHVYIHIFISQLNQIVALDLLIVVIIKSMKYEINFMQKNSEAQVLYMYINV